MTVLPLARRLLPMPEFLSGCTLVLWSKWVLFQPVSLAQREPYHVLTGAISAEVLELAGLFVGLAQIIATLLNRRWPRVAMAFPAAVLWLTLANGLWMGDPSAPGAASYLGWGVASIGIMLLLICRRPR